MEQQVVKIHWFEPKMVFINSTIVAEGYVIHPEAHQSTGMVDGKMGRLEVAYIYKDINAAGLHIGYKTTCWFPDQPMFRHFATLEEAKAKVEEKLNWFVTCCQQLTPTP